MPEQICRKRSIAYTSVIMRRIDLHAHILDLAQQRKPWNTRARFTESDMFTHASHSGTFVILIKSSKCIPICSHALEMKSTILFWRLFWLCSSHFRFLHSQTNLETSSSLNSRACASCTISESHSVLSPSLLYLYSKTQVLALNFANLHVPLLLLLRFCRPLLENNQLFSWRSFLSAHLVEFPGLIIIIPNFSQFIVLVLGLQSFFHT